MLVKKLRNDSGWWVSTGRSYDDILELDSVKMWINNYRSENTRDAYLRCLGYVLDANALTPDELLTLDDKEARLAVIKVTQKLVQEGKNIQARMVLTALRGFFDANDKTLKLRRIDRVKKTKKRASLEYIPTKQDIYRMVDACNRIRDKAIILCLFQSGVRVGCLVKWRVRMVRKDLFPEIHYPLALKITPREDTKISGYGLGFYYTFIHEESCKALKDYIMERRDKEKSLNNDDFIFKPIHKSKLGHISTNKVRTLVKEKAGSIKLDSEGIWTHLLRKSFRKVLYKSNVNNDFAEALMGHRLQGSKENYFDNKDTETLAKIYSSCNWSRVTESYISREDVRTEVIGALMGKISDAELAPIAQKMGISPQQIRSMIRRIGGKGSDEETEALLETERTARNGGNGNNCESKLISEDELCGCINDGWDIVRELSNGKIVVKRPKPN